MTMENVFEELLAKIKSYEDTVYYEPMDHEEIEEFQKRLGVEFKPTFRKFLQEVGLVQDVIGKVNVNKDILEENYSFIKSDYKDYVPIYFADRFEEEEDNYEEDKLLLIKNSENDDWVYELKINDKDEMSELENTGEKFLQLIEDSYEKIQKEKRIKNKDKIRLIEYKITTANFGVFLRKFDGQFEQITSWVDKYNPNIFGDQMAEFLVLGESVKVERSDDHKTYRFEYEESIKTNKEKSNLSKLKEFILSTGVKNEISDFGIINLE